MKLGSSRRWAAGLLAASVLIWTPLALAASPTTRPGDPREQLERAFAILQQADERIPADGYDPVAVVKNLGGRPDDLFAWVRDNTRWVPYRGGLRGPTGVLIDRIGNSLDRSLLLAELYHHTPSSVRLAHATLSPDQAKSLYEKLQAAPRTAGVALESRDGSGPRGIAAAQRLDRLGEGVIQTAAGESAALSTALGALPQAANAANDDPIAVLTDHWWLQRAVDGKWVDLDVTLPGSKPGDAVCPAAETLAPDALPKDLWHTVRIAVIAERWADGKLSQTTVLSRVARPGAVVGTPIYLTHIPLDWTKDPSSGTGADAVKAARTQALVPTEWVPMLRLGLESASDAAIRPDGSIDAKPQMDALARAGSTIGKKANAAASVFDADPIAPTADSARPTGLFTAEWVEYTLHAPGTPDEIIRREIFDLVGPAARVAGVAQQPAPDELTRANAALMLRGRTDIVLLPCQLSSAFVGHLMLGALVSSKTSILKALTAMQQQGGGEAEAGVSPPIPTPLYGLALVRRLYSAAAADWFIARSNVFTYHSFARLTPDNGQVFVEATDLVSNPVAVEPWSKADVRKLRIDQGVLDTAAEGAFLPAGGERLSASNTLSGAALQSLGWVVVRAVADLDRVKSTPDVLSRIRAELSAGRIAIIPESPVRLGAHDTAAWWAVDPITGVTLGIGENGWGQTMAEYAEKLQLWIMAHKRYVCLGATAATVLNIISPILGLNELEGDALNAVQTALDAACAGA